MTKGTLRARALEVGKLVGYDIAVVERRDGYALEVVSNGGADGTRVTSGCTAREADAFLRGALLIAIGNDR